MSDSSGQPPTTDQLRNRIDSGTTGEKVAMPDPAAAPLGTDAEAGGVPPSATERRMAAAQAPQVPQHDRPRMGAPLYLVLVGVVVVLVVAIVVLALPR